ncbi:MAG: aldo/keto reductase [Myxococcota bacterium]
MRTRELGQTGITLSEISLGTWGFGGAYGPLGEDAQRQIVEEATSAGITTFDVAPLWGRGAVESLLGDALSGQDVRWITRGGAAWDDDHVVHRFDEPSLRRDLEGSLERLKTVRVDVWLLHEPTEEALRDDALKKALETFGSESLFGAWGVSTSSADVARMALAMGAQVLCLPYSLLTRTLLDDLAPELSVAGCGVLARSPLLHGLLAGRWTEYRQFGEEDHRRARWTPRSLSVRVRQTNTLRFLVKGEVPSMGAAALRFVLTNAAVTSCVVGARRPVQARDLVRLAGEPPYLPEADLQRLDTVLTTLGT